MMDPPPLPQVVETVRLKIPEIRLQNRIQGESLGSKPGRKYVTNCVICDTRCETDDSFPVTGADGILGEDLEQEWALRAEVLRAFCTHLNVPEYLPSSKENDVDVDRETNITVLLKAFHLCPVCKDSAIKLVSLNRHLETLLADIGSLAESFRTAISISVAEKQSGLRRLEDDNENYSVSQFRHFVLRNGEAVGTELVEQEPDDGGFNNQTDFAYLETVSSVCTSEGGFAEQDDVELSVENIKYENSSPPPSPSPSFSPISFIHDAELFPWTENSSTVDEVDDQVDSIVPTKRSSKLKPQHPKGFNRRKKIMKPKPNRPTKFKAAKMYKKKPVFSLKSLPKCDRAGYKTMVKMCIPFKRLQINLTRVEDEKSLDESPGAIIIASKSTIRKSIENQNDVKVKIGKKRGRKSRKELSFMASVYGCKDEPEVDPKMKPRHHSPHHDPDYLPRPGMNDVLDEQQSSNNVTNIDIPKGRALRARNHLRITEVDVPKAENKTEVVDVDAFFQLPGGTKRNGHFSNTTLEGLAHGTTLVKNHNGIEKLNEPCPVYKGRVVRRLTADGKIMVGSTEIVVNSSGLYNCGTCGNLSQTERALIDHVKKVHAILRPSMEDSKTVEISKESKSANYLNAHAAGVQNDKRMVYKGFEILKTEDGRHHCLTCKMNFKRIFGVQYHIRQQHKNLFNRGFNFVPTTTKKTYTDEGKKPFRKKLNNALVQSCREKIEQSHSDHIKPINLNWYKRTCKSNKRKLTRIRRSIRTSGGRLFFRGTEILKTISGNHKCGMCKQVTTTLSALQKHIVSLHKSAEGKFICQYCGKTLRYKFLLENHELSHLNDTNIPCDQCGKMFKQLNSLTYHIRHVHNIKKRHECQICAKKYYLTKDFMAHKRTHTNERPFTCNVTDCGMSFASLHSVKVHARTHDAKDQPYKCIECHSSFITQKSMQAHILKIHEAKLANQYKSNFHANQIPITDSNSYFDDEEPPLLFRQDIFVSENYVYSDDDNNIPPQLLPFYHFDESDETDNESWTYPISR